MTVPAAVTVVSCVYGTRYDPFVPEWAAAVAALDPAPAAVIVSTDKRREIPGALVLPHEKKLWKHQQAFHLQQAILAAPTEWVWVVDIDDLALPNALDGLDQVEADVWQMGYLRNGAEPYLPPQLSGRAYLSLTGNPFTAGSAIRTDIFQETGGFYDVAFQDWALWRRLARFGATFQASERAHYVYRRHNSTRSALELRPERRAHHEEEMIEREQTRPE